MKELIVILAIVFAGGMILTVVGDFIDGKSRLANVGNGETVRVYANGKVYSNSSNEPLGGRTIWKDNDGAIKSSYIIIGPGPLVLSHIVLPATPEQVAKWQKAQDALKTNGA